MLFKKTNGDILDVIINEHENHIILMYFNSWKDVPITPMHDQARPQYPKVMING